MTHLISDKLVELVEKHSDEILKRWTSRLLSDPSTSSFLSSHMKYIEDKARSILKNLGQWVSYETSKEEVGRLYAAEGIELFQMAIPLCEGIRAIMVLRRTLWNFVLNESAFDSAFQLHQMQELSDRVILFFDRSLFYMVRGYTEAMHRKYREYCTLSPEDDAQVFFEKSFYNR